MIDKNCPICMIDCGDWSQGSCPDCVRPIIKFGRYVEPERHEENTLKIQQDKSGKYKIELTENEYIRLWAHVGASYFKEIQELLVEQGRSDLVNQDLEIYEKLTEFGVEKGFLKEV